MNYGQISPWLTILICVIDSIYLLCLFHSTVNLATPTNIPPMHYIILFLGALIPLVPFVQRLRVGKLIELERDIQNTKSEVKDFKNEVRQMISVVNTSINSISNLTNTTNLNFNFTDLLRQAKEELAHKPSPKLIEVQRIKDELQLEDENTIMTLARTRIKLEYLLRKILGRQTSIPIEKQTEKIKFMTAEKLYKLFLQQYTEYDYLRNSFDYVLKICNAAMHGQIILDAQAEEALNLGARLISTLTELNNET